MSRIIKTIEIEGQPAAALFDTGAINTYVRRSLLGGATLKPVRAPYRAILGGQVLEVKETALVRGAIEGYGFDTEVVPVDDLGRADGKQLDAILGALTMEKWEIKLDPKSGALDLEGLRRREFTEY